MRDISSGLRSEFRDAARETFPQLAGASNMDLDRFVEESLNAPGDKRVIRKAFWRVRGVEPTPWLVELKFLGV